MSKNIKIGQLVLIRSKKMDQVGFVRFKESVLLGSYNTN